MPRHTSSAEAQKRAHLKYQKEKVVQYSLKMFKNTDDDVIEHLSTLGNKRAYILNLIREDIKKS